jgi:hypothetical protein
MTELREKKKENLQKLAKILREAEHPLTGKQLQNAIGVGSTTCWRYLKELEAYLEPTEELNMYSQGKTHLFFLVNYADRYGINKTEGGYMDPTASAAMSKYMKEDKTVKDWKYNVGDVWYAENAKSMFDPYLIVATSADRAIMLRVYEESDFDSKNVDLNNPQIISDMELKKAIDTGFICTKPYKWLKEKATYRVTGPLMADIRIRLSRNLQLFEDVYKEQAYKEAGEEIVSLTEALEKAKADFKELQEKTSMVREAPAPKTDISTEMELALLKKERAMLERENKRLAAMLFASWGVKPNELNDLPM